MLSFLVLATSWVVFTASAGLSFIGSKAATNPLHPAGSPPTVVTISQVFRQGWGFFTRDAREERNQLFVVTATEGWERSADEITADRANNYGFSRRARAYAADVALIIQYVKDNSWKECREGETLNSCAERADPLIMRRADHSLLGFCGTTLAIVRSRPVDYAYRSYAHDPPRRLAVVTVECE